MYLSHKKYSAFSLIELLVIIVVISITTVALFGVIAKSVAGSADPMLRVQAIAIAQGYMEEILLKDFQDPDVAETNSCEEGPSPANRSVYDDVFDYVCVNDTAGALDQFGNPLAGLSAYNVAVAVVNDSLGSGGQSAPARRVTVTVTHDANANINIILNGYKTNF